jgi:sugar lactone lactonase YvrE
MRKRLLILCAVVPVVVAAMIAGVAASAAPPGATPTVTAHWVTGLAGGSGSTVGPDGALYVPEPSSGKVYRVDPDTGTRTEVAHCLPPQVIPLGGAMDVAFIGNTLYALVTIVSDPNTSVVNIGNNPDHNGIYRVDGPGNCTMVADIGAFAIAHPPDADIFLDAGVQYAMEPYRGGFLVTDGHHNRVYRVTLGGEVSEFITFGDVVPTGLAVQGNTIYMAEAGPILGDGSEIGKVIGIDAHSGTVTDVAGPAPLVVDVERGRGQTMFALAQGTHSNPNPGSPAEPNTGELLRVDGNGGFSVVATGLDQPTSLEIIGTTAYVVTLGGEIWKIDDISGPPYGH